MIDLKNPFYYHRDDKLWIVGHCRDEQIPHRKTYPWHTPDLYRVHCAYLRTTPSTFRMMKERDPSPTRSLFVLFLQDHGIEVENFKGGYYRFASEKDEFLFDLKFGGYDVLK